MIGPYIRESLQLQNQGHRFDGVTRLYIYDRWFIVSMYKTKSHFVFFFLHLMLFHHISIVWEKQMVFICREQMEVDFFLFIL